MEDALLRLLVIHAFDPRGSKVGGIETHVRQVIRRHPSDMQVLVIGIDDSGMLELGRVHRIKAMGTEFDFFPIIHIPSEEQSGAATEISRSVTLRFALALARWVPRLRALIKGESCAAEIERFEFAPFVKMLGVPFVLIAHNEGDPRTDKMDSLLSRYWYVNFAAERIAVKFASRVFGVTPKIRDRIAGNYPEAASSTEVLSVSVDTDLFRPSPFPMSDDILRIVYAGRLDEFKDPETMFAVMARVHAALDGKLEFHYCGSGDPNRFLAFPAIEPFTVRHGALTPDQVAAVMRSVHMGILVSHWEGMPCFLLELLSSGRPFAGLRLPQFDLVIEPGVNGRMAERAASNDETISSVTAVVLQQWAEICSGQVDPETIHAGIIPWSIDRQLDRLFSAQRAIARRGAPPRRYLKPEPSFER